MATTFGVVERFKSFHPYGYGNSRFKFAWKADDKRLCYNVGGFYFSFDIAIKPYTRFHLFVYLGTDIAVDLSIGKSKYNHRVFLAEKDGIANN